VKALVLTWEFLPFITGGLGMACYGLVKSMLGRGIEVFLVLPAKTVVCFHLVKPEDADLLQPVFLSKEFLRKCNEKKFETVEEGLKLLGMSCEFNAYTCSGEETFRKVEQYSVNVREIVKNFDFDLIHAHDWLTFPAAMDLNSMSGKPLVCHIHSTEFDRSGGRGNSRVHDVERSSLAISDRVVAVSEYTAAHITREYGVDRSKITVVYNAFQKNNKCVYRRRIFKDPVILFLGRITLQKGPEYFLEAAKRVLDVYPGAWFIMAGRGDLEKDLIHRSASYRLKTRFLFTGFLKRNEVERILSASDIIVLPSLSEPFGIVPLEAMSFGVVAIISKWSGVSEIVQSVFKIDPRDIDGMVSLIISLLKDPEKMARTGRAGAKEVENMGWDDAGILIKKIYEGLLC
jgi:glycosyltransferase involved in cell wall biosynthesis